MDQSADCHLEEVRILVFFIKLRVIPTLHQHLLCGLDGHTPGVLVLDESICKYLLDRL